MFKLPHRLLLAAIPACLANAALAQCPAPQWVRVNATEPSPRTAPGMAYHEASRRTILFGGMIGLDWPNVGAHGETLAWNGTVWTTLDPGGQVPFKRFETPLTYDSARGRIVLHSGAAIEWSPSNHHIPGTYEFDGTDWYFVHPTGPLARHAHGLVYDAARNVTVMIQGKHGMDDLWEWNSTAATWTHRLNGQMPSRGWAGAAYDPVRQRVVVFGGYSADFIKLGDTWEWDGTSWELRAPTQPQPAGPGERNGAQLAWDPVRQRVVMVGGESYTAQHSDMWEWTGSSWTPRQATGLTPRVNHALAYDTHRSRLIAVCGVRGGSSLGDTWELITDPRIDTAVNDVSVDVGSQAVLSVGASGTGTLSYQWFRGTVPLADDARIIGSTTATLTILGVQAADAGRYDVIITGACAQKTRSHGKLTVTCRADVNGSGGIDTADLTVLLGRFGQSVTPGTSGDVNGDGVVNTSDLTLLLAAFGSTC